MDLDQGARLCIILVIFLLTTASNTSVGVLLYRFKNLRTIPNILILSSCIADILNHIFNIPGFVAGYIVRDSKYFVGRWLALALAASTLFFTMVNLMSMTLMMVDRLCAFKFNLAYRVWRTRSKAFVAIAAKWISCFVISMVFLVPIWDIDLGNVATREYRKVYFSKQGSFVAVLMPLFIINTVMIAIVTCTVIKHKNKINAMEMGLNQQSILDKTRKLNELKAIRTISLTMVAFFLCYIPLTLYIIMASVGVASLTEESWPGFAASSCLFLPGLLNPFIYAIRKRRFRRAFKSFFKDPFGSSDLSE